MEFSEFLSPRYSGSSFFKRPVPLNAVKGDFDLRLTVQSKKSAGNETESGENEEFHRSCPQVGQGW